MHAEKLGSDRHGPWHTRRRLSHLALRCTLVILTGRRSELQIRKSNFHLHRLPFSVFIFLKAGDCEVTIECNSFTCESVTNGLQINVSRKAKINIAGNVFKSSTLGLKNKVLIFVLLTACDANNFSVFGLLGLCSKTRWEQGPK